ncbi:glycosyl hydrolase [Aerococcaceae bacterium zg-BR9]|uniref:glycoside hydrolase family 30 protein n=1 Tax=Aerococcaceae bacterium zg-1292 TaxID=2774330 RepID=UPI0040647A0F|nr:glycosyl hydrolase [Aerococcaceae bacterium zg-BR9]
MIITCYMTSDENNQFKSVDFNEIRIDTAENIITIDVNSTIKQQQIDGFGASFTDASAFLINQCLPDELKNRLMKELFDSVEGIGISALRNPMGACDYARTIYSYNDLPEGMNDPGQNKFSIAHDLESILPLTKQALDINPKMKIFASPWSPPGWMKTSADMRGGQLLTKYYESYAIYFVKFIEAYQQHGIDIYAVTPQNEPLYEPTHYPSMEFLACDEARFVSEYLKPNFVKAGIHTKIFGYDHNWDRVDYAFDLMDYAYDSFDGIAWHWYGGRPISQTRVQAFFPEKEIHFTEGSGGDWIPGFEQAFANLMRTGISILRHNSKSMILWNIALDEDNGPCVPGFGKSTCRGLVKVFQKEQRYELTQDYYGLAHFSKCIQPGAYRLESNDHLLIKNVIFENIDGSRVAVIFNDSTSEMNIQLNGFDKQNNLMFKLKEKSAITLYFK